MATEDGIANLIGQARELAAEEEALRLADISERVIEMGERLREHLWRWDRMLVSSRIQIATAIRIRREIRQACERLDRVLEQARPGRPRRKLPDCVPEDIVEPTRPGDSTDERERKPRE